MGYFSRKPLVEIEGTIDRIGPIGNASFVLMLTGDERVFETYGISPAEPVHGLRLARPGDRVRLTVRGDGTGVRRSVNLTMAEGRRAG